MADCLALVGQDIMVVDEKVISSRNPLHAGSWTRSNALAEATKLVGVRDIPLGFIARIATEVGSV